MTDTFQYRLTEAKERKFRLHKAERRRDELQQELHKQERLIMQLELQLESEQADVEKLTRMSLTNLFYTILRSKEEQLELERRQALAVALRLQEAKQILTDMEADMHRIGNDLTNYRNAESEYDALMAEIEASLRGESGSNHKLKEMDEQIAEQTVLVKEVLEALTAGQRVLTSLEDASASLEKAENWGKWDMWGGGGVISTHLKHNHVDDAKQYIHNANYLMIQFRNELADLKRSTHIEIEISGLLKMADYWFDGLITDWVVQGRIQNAQTQVLEAIHQVRSAVKRLQEEHSLAESALAGMKSKRIVWIENNGS